MTNPLSLVERHILMATEPTPKRESLEDRVEPSARLCSKSELGQRQHTSAIVQTGSIPVSSGHSASVATSQLTPGEGEQQQPTCTRASTVVLRGLLLGDWWQPRFDL